jgi:dTDP-4-amino-4,6-dideoxygalactose transaminase
MTRINRIAHEHGLRVIEDAAQAHGATWEGRRAGVLGDAACFSFYPGKNLGAYGDAGAVVTNQAEIAEQVRLLRNHGRRAKYLHEQIGFGERLDALQAAILGAKLSHLGKWIEERNRLAARYTSRLADLELVLPQVSEQARHAWHLYVVRTPRRDEMLEHLHQQGIGAGVHYPIPLHLQPAYAELGYGRGDLPVTELVADTCLSLPLYPEMTEEQQDRVIQCIAEFVGQPERAA